jgi:hypothetical protein
MPTFRTNSFGTVYFHGAKTSLWTMDYDAKGHTGLEHPACRQIAWVYATIYIRFRELGNELDKNYDYDKILLSTYSGSSAIITERKRILAILFFVCWCKTLPYWRLGAILCI